MLLASARVSAYACAYPPQVYRDFRDHKYLCIYIYICICGLSLMGGSGQSVHALVSVVCFDLLAVLGAALGLWQWAWWRVICSG